MAEQVHTLLEASKQEGQPSQGMSGCRDMLEDPKLSILNNKALLRGQSRTLKELSGSVGEGKRKQLSGQLFKEQIPQKII